MKFDLFDLVIIFGDGSESVLYVNNSGENWESHISPEGYYFGPNAIEGAGFTVSGWAKGIMEKAEYYGGIKSIEIFDISEIPIVED